MLDFTRLAVWWRGRRHRVALPVPVAPTEQPTLGHTESGAPVHFPAPSREHAGHLAVFGGSGCGKTLMIANALVEEVVRGQR